MLQQLPSFLSSNIVLFRALLLELDTAKCQTTIFDFQMLRCRYNANIRVFQVEHSTKTFNFNPVVLNNLLFLSKCSPHPFSRWAVCRR